MNKKIELINDFQELINNDFHSERDFSKYIIENKEIFCKDVLGIKYKSHNTEMPFRKISHLHDNEPRVDIVFWDNKGNAYFVELKGRNNSYLDCMTGIGQCLSYYYLARANDIKVGGVYLVANKHCNLAPLIIRDNNLKIEYVYFSKDKWAKVFNNNE